MRYIIALALTLIFCSPAHAERYSHLTRQRKLAPTLSCNSTIDVRTSRNVLFKNANIHGGRGRTFLDQGHQLKGVRTLAVAGTNGKVFACFGLYRCDRPYGCRYYQAMCGDRLSNRQFAAQARANGGSSYALVGTNSGKCFKIDASSARYGSVRK